MEGGKEGARSRPSPIEGGHPTTRMRRVTPLGIHVSCQMETTGRKEEERTEGGKGEIHYARAEGAAQSAAFIPTNGRDKELAAPGGGDGGTGLN